MGNDSSLATWSLEGAARDTRRLRLIIGGFFFFVDLSTPTHLLNLSPHIPSYYDLKKVKTQ